MSLLFPRPRKAEQRLIDRASVYGTVDPITAFLNGSDVVSSAETVLRLAPVYAATNLIASQLASLPWPGYVDRDGMGAKLDPQPELLTNPSQYGTVYDWKFRLATSVLLRGNAVGLRGGEYRGWPGKVEWLDPSDVTCEEDTPGKPLLYKGFRLDEAEIIHIPGYVLPGKRWGLSPIGAFRSIVDLGLAAQDFAADWFVNGAPIPKGILKNTELAIVKEQAKAAKESYKQNMSHGDIFVTGKDWEWTSVQMPADDVRFIEAIKMSATQIAAVYLVPPELIGGETGSSLTYSTVEQNMLNLGSLALRPWATRFETAITGLLPRGQYVKVNLDAMIRSDTKTKYDVFKIQSEIKHRTQNELRALDDLPPIEGGDEFPEPPAPAPTVGPEPKAGEARHLAGQHDQSTHGKGGGGSRAGMGDVKVPVDDLRGGSAEQFLRPDGTFTPERQRLHDDIVRRAVDGIPKSDDPTFHMLGGGTAAGKTTAINSGIVTVPGAKDAVQINADDVKAELPEAGTRKDWACFTHEESSYVAKRIQAAAIERGQDFVLDGTGDSSAPKVMAKIDAARAAGYKVVGTYATVPTGLAIQRSNARGDKTGRYVPEEAIRVIHASVSDTFPKVASSFDSITLIDTAGATPRVLARASLGSRVEVVDDIGYTAFLAKANG